MFIILVMSVVLKHCRSFDGNSLRKEEDMLQLLLLLRLLFLLLLLPLLVLELVLLILPPTPPPRRLPHQTYVRHRIVDDAFFDTGRSSSRTGFLPPAFASKIRYPQRQTHKHAIKAQIAILDHFGRRAASLRQLHAGVLARARNE